MAGLDSDSVGHIHKALCSVLSTTVKKEKEKGDKLSLVVCACNLNTQEAKAGRPS